MSNRKHTRTLSRYLAPTLLAGALLFPAAMQATPYATALTNHGTGNSIAFRLNESGIVTVISTNLSGTTLTNNLGNRTLGLINFTNSGNFPGAFSVIVAKTNTPGYLSGVNLQISADGTNGVSTNTLRFNSPRGVAVNTNVASPYFGRIYVANSATGTVTRLVGDGVYLLNADFSDAVGQGNIARTAGIAFTNTATGDPDANTPWRIAIGEDNNLYISDFSTNTATIYVTDPDVLTGTNVLAGLGTAGGVSPSPNHGRFCSSVIATGSTNSGNLVIYAIDSDNTTTLDFAPNHIMKYDVGAGPLPVDLTVGVAATNVDNSSLLNIAGVTVDLASGPDGKFYPMQNRSDGNEGGIFVVDPAVDGSPFFPTPDGAWDPVYDSKAATFDTYGLTNDILRLARGVAISPDGKYMGIVRDDNAIWVVSLTNGVPDLTSRRLVTTSPATSIGRDIAFDAAGNIYTVSSGQAVMRVLSPGYTTIATTTWSPTGTTFSVTNITPANTVKIFPSIASATEGSTDGEFTFSRTGNASAALTVTYVISGTATRGADYATNVFGIGGGTTNTVTFAAGVASTNVTIAVINDSIGELTETVSFTLLSSTNYVSANNQAATVTITDDGVDLPNVNVRALGLGFYELLTNRPAKFAVSISSPWGVDITANVSLTGTAASGVDYANPNSFTLTIPAGQTTVTNTVATIDNAAIDADRTLIYNIVNSLDGSYTNIGAIAATNTLRNDDIAPTNALFADDFDTDTSANYAVKSVGNVNDALFSMDYSTNGVPMAPHTTNGTTRGLRLRANIVATGTAGGVSVTPLNLALTNDYRMRFDLWMNFNGPMPGGGAGSSEYFTVGLGVSNTRTNVTTTAGLLGSSVVFSADGDGGFAEATGDFIVYTNSVSIASNINIYAAPSRDNFAAYYGEFGDQFAPAAQLAAFPRQTGAANGGTLAFAWHDVIITKRGYTYTWTIDGLPIATMNYPTPTVSNNFSLGYQDINTSVADTNLMNFGLVDNLRVEPLPFSDSALTNALLLNLNITPPGALSPAFNSSTFSYAATNAYVASPTVTALAAHPNATLQLSVNGGAFTPLGNGVASSAVSLNLNPPQNTLVVRVTAPDTTTVQDYTVNVLRQPSLTVPTLTNSVSGSTLTMSWPSTHVGYRLETQTNALSTGLSSTWFTVPDSANTNTVSITVDPANPTVFYRLVYP